MAEEFPDLHHNVGGGERMQMKEKRGTSIHERVPLIAGSSFAFMTKTGTPSAQLRLEFFPVVPLLRHLLLLLATFKIF